LLLIATDVQAQNLGTTATPTYHSHLASRVAQFATRLITRPMMELFNTLENPVVPKVSAIKNPTPSARITLVLQNVPLIVVTMVCATEAQWLGAAALQ